MIEGKRRAAKPVLGSASAGMTRLEQTGGAVRAGLRPACVDPRMGRGCKIHP